MKRCVKVRLTELSLLVSWSTLPAPTHRSPSPEKQHKNHSAHCMYSRHLTVCLSPPQPRLLMTFKYQFLHQRNFHRNCQQNGIYLFHYINVQAICNFFRVIHFFPWESTFQNIIYWQSSSVQFVICGQKHINTSK